MERREEKKEKWVEKAVLVGSKLRVNHFNTWFRLWNVICQCKTLNPYLVYVYLQTYSAFGILCISFSFEKIAHTENDFLYEFNPIIVPIACCALHAFHAKTCAHNTIL